jgi:hypothetical protein
MITQEELEELRKASEQLKLPLDDLKRHFEQIKESGKVATMNLGTHETPEVARLALAIHRSMAARNFREALEDEEQSPPAAAGFAWRWVARSRGFFP